MIPRIATPLGGGIARSGLTCGALVGAVMAAGIRLGRSDEGGDRDPSYDAAQRIVYAFRERFGSTSCRELTGLDLATAEGRQAWMDQGLEEKCTKLVEWAVGAVYDCG